MGSIEFDFSSGGRLGNRIVDLYVFLLKIIIILLC